MTDTEQVKAIYLAYPRHIAPRAAQKAIQKAAERLVSDKSQPDEHAARRYLWKMATAYARSPAGQKPQKGSTDDFRPHPSTWFNQDHFADDQREWQKPNGATNGRLSSGTKASRVLDATKAAVERIENRHRARGAGPEEERGIHGGTAGPLCGDVIEGTL